jgi:hypothetical protein
MNDTISNLLGQAVATLIGAYAAFALERQRQKRKEQRTQAHEVKRALFALAVQRIFLLNVKQQVLDPSRDDPRRMFTVRATRILAPQVGLDVESLGFMLDDASELLQHIVHADITCRNVIMILEARNECHAEFQQRVEPIRIAGQLEIPYEDIYAAIGPVLSANLEIMTESLYGMTIATLEIQMGSAHREYFARRFPKEKIFKEDVPPDQQPSKSSCGRIRVPYRVLGRHFRVPPASLKRSANRRQHAVDSSE